jgi:hypothetical protein
MQCQKRETWCQDSQFGCKCQNGPIRRLILSMLTPASSIASRQQLSTYLSSNISLFDSGDAQNDGSIVFMGRVMKLFCIYFVRTR